MHSWIELCSHNLAMSGTIGIAVAHISCAFFVDAYVQQGLWIHPMIAVVMGDHT